LQIYFFIIFFFFGIKNVGVGGNILGSTGSTYYYFLALVSCVLASCKEMLWHMKFIKSARPGLKRPSQVTATNAEKKLKCEKA
jgi:hypothetical protein